MRPARWGRHAAAWCLATLIAFAQATGAAAADVAQSPAEASAALFQRMSAKDLGGVQQLLPQAGFSEIGADGATVHQLDLHAFEALFQSGADIAFTAEEMKVQTFGDTAVVTGVRVGGIAPKGGTPVPRRRLFTMVWLKQGAGWQLRHLHLSEIR
ncbi:MAG: hypothetical protein GAK35_01383 [Herbaspirillum frisingense]|uniref:DUF4440 domain-containing protein n=1 Tax=Herbaspirillum frisingense TaxID=92645 RepID=A0A7V8JV14_9BURK|nr:MAG: hypothetical protein GAK35_01383 [Herbaspirillum frisingense]